MSDAQQFEEQLARMFCDKHLEDLMKIKQAADRDVQEFVHKTGAQALQAAFMAGVRIGFTEGKKYQTIEKKG
jgi:hypothetical protein